MHGTAPWIWSVFVAAVVVLLVLDLVANRGERRETRRNALAWSGIWIGSGLAFGGFVWFALGGRAAEEYFAAWFLEQSLSLDNLFVFLLVFQTLAVPRRFQHRVLFWGVLGAIVFRAVFILVGTTAIERWSWISYVLGATLLYAAWRAYRQKLGEERRSAVVAWLSRRFPVTDRPHGEEFVAREDGEEKITPLLIALIAIELTDIVFAIDSIPAALSVSRNFFVIYSANIFAVLGMRALYVLLASTIAKLRHLHYALAAILVFTAFKLIAEDWISIPPLVSVGVIAAAIATAVWLSLRGARGGNDPRLQSSR
jgi:tellurite resistance protein TerC